MSQEEGQNIDDERHQQPPLSRRSSLEDDVPLHDTDDGFGADDDDDDDDVSIALDVKQAVPIIPLASPRPDGDLLHLLADQGNRKFHRRVAVFVTGWMWFMSGAATSLTLFTTLEPPRFPVCPEEVVPRLLMPDLINLPQLRSLQEMGGYSSSLVTMEDGDSILLGPPPALGGFCNPNVPLPANDCLSEYTYNHKGVSIVSDFDVPLSVCESRPWKNVSWVHSAYFVGVLVGALFLVPFSDKIGRIPVLSFGVLLLVAATFTSIFAVHVLMYGIARIFVGIGSTCGSLPSFVLLSELIPNRDRTKLILVQALAFASGAAFISGLAALVPSWRLLTLISLAPSLWFLCGCICCTGVYIESPKWLAVRGNMSQAFHNWLKVAKMNSVQLDENLDLQSFTRMEIETAHNLKLETQQDLDEEIALMSIQYLTSPDSTPKIFRSFPTSVWLLVCGYLWIACATIYYGVLLDYSDVTTAIFSAAVTPGDTIIPPTFQFAAVPGPAVGGGPELVMSENPSSPATSQSVPAPLYPQAGGLRRQLAGSEVAANAWAPPVYPALPATLPVPGDITQFTLAAFLNPEITRITEAAPIVDEEATVLPEVSATKAASIFGWLRREESDEENLIEESSADAETRLEIDNASASHPVLESDQINMVNAAKQMLSAQNWTLIAPEMKEPLVNYVKALEGYVKNSTNILLDQARHLPQTANRLYGQTKDSGTVKNFLQDVTAQFQETDPMATYWRKTRLQAGLVMISFVLEFPIYVLVMRLAGHPWFGRKWCVVTFLITGGAALGIGGAATFFGAQGEHQGIFVLTMVVLGRCMIAGVFQLLYLYTAELVPTSVRTGVIGTMSALARIGCIGAGPLAKVLDNASKGTALVVFGLLTIIGGCLVITTLPETNGVQLFDTFDTLELHYKRIGFYERFMGWKIHKILAWVGTRMFCCVGRFVGRRLGLPNADQVEPTDFESKGRAWLKKRLNQRSEKVLRDTTTSTSMFGSNARRPRKFMLLTDGSNSSFGGDNMPSGSG